MNLTEFFNWKEPWLWLGMLLLEVIFLIIIRWKKIAHWWNNPVYDKEDEEEDLDWEEEVKNPLVENEQLLEKLRAWKLSNEQGLLTDDQLLMLIELIKGKRKWVTLLN